MRAPLEFCRNGLHRMAGSNLLWHARYDRATGAKSLVRECRACANERYRTKRGASRRNLELEQQALAALSGTEPGPVGLTAHAETPAPGG